MSDQCDEYDEHDESAEEALLPFEDGSRLIRRQWQNGRWYFSVVDVIAVLTNSDAPGTYWRVLKHRLQQEGANETVTICNALKMLALDGKMRLTDAADAKTMLRIIQSVPSPKAEPVKQWLAWVGAQRLEEAAATLDEAQRRQLLRGEVADRNISLAETARSARVVSGRDFAVFQDHGYMGLYNGEKARDIAACKGLAKGKAILDWMGSEELGDNWFRIIQAEAKIKREGIVTREDANAAHLTIGRVVRKAIADMGGTMP